MVYVYTHIWRLMNYSKREKRVWWCALLRVLQLSQSGFNVRGVCADLWPLLIWEGTVGHAHSREFLLYLDPNLIQHLTHGMIQHTLYWILALNNTFTVSCLYSSTFSICSFTLPHSLHKVVLTNYKMYTQVYTVRLPNHAHSYHIAHVFSYVHVCI